jgi:cytochrome P450
MIQDDFITWVLINTPESHRTVDEIALKLLSVNFAGVHTSSLNMGHALYWLLARYVVRWLSDSLFSPVNGTFSSSRPKYVMPLREEIEETIGRLGWTKDAIGQMPRLDSFMKESMRMSPLGARE